MDWTYLYLLPAYVSFLWPVIIVLGRKRVIKAQWLMSFTMFLVGFTIMTYMVWFRNKQYSLYVYDLLYTLLVVFSIPTFYCSVCALTSSKGVTRAQRQVYWPAIVYSALVLMGGFAIGPARYQELSLVVREGYHIPIVPGDGWYNFMLVVNHYMFNVLAVAYGLVVVVICFVKTHRFHLRFNAFYANRQNQPKLMDWPIITISIAYVILAVGINFVSYSDPNAHKVMNICIIFAVTLVQCIMGYYTFNLSYSAEQLARLMRDEYIKEQSKNQLS